MILSLSRMPSAENASKDSAQSPAWRRSDSTAWGMQVPALAGAYRVYAPDRRGHGRTFDTDDPFTYEAAAAETITFLEQVVGGPAHLVGWSDGGNVALLVAAQRPDLVR